MHVSLADAAGGIAVALGCGLLVGAERERRKHERPAGGAAGIRTFVVVALTGAIAAIIADRVLIAVFGAGVFALAALSYWAAHREDAGLTTEVALGAMYLVGVLAVSSPWLAGGVSVALAVVLWSRESIHGVVTEKLSEQEVHDGLILAAVALVLLPLAPMAPVTWLGGIAPRALVSVLLAILAVQAAGHVARRLLGDRLGFALSGLLGGFVSSLATIASMGSLARARRESLGLAIAAGALSCVATWVQILVMAFALDPLAAAGLAKLALAGLMPPLLVSALAARWNGNAPTDAGARGPGATPLRLREALAVAAFLGVVSIGVSFARRALGESGLFGGVVLAAFVDVHAAVGVLLALGSTGDLAGRDLAIGVSMAVSINSITRTVAAQLAGGIRYAASIGAGLVLGAALAWVVALTAFG